MLQVVVRTGFFRIFSQRILSAVPKGLSIPDIYPVK